MSRDRCQLCRETRQCGLIRGEAVAEWGFGVSEPYRHENPKRMIEPALRSGVIDIPRAKSWSILVSVLNGIRVSVAGARLTS